MGRLSRRRVLKTFAPAVGAGAGCSALSSQQSERELWTVSSGPVDIEWVDVTISIERETATTDEPARILLTVRNPGTEPRTIRHGHCPIRSDNHTYLEELVLFPTALEEEFSPSPRQRDCWKPDPNSYSWPCEGGFDEREIPPDGSWSQAYTVWVAKNGDCLPDDTFEFKLWGFQTDDNRANSLGTFSLDTEPLATPTTR